MYKSFDNDFRKLNISVDVQEKFYKNLNKYLSKLYIECNNSNKNDVVLSAKIFPINNLNYKLIEFCLTNNLSYTKSIILFLKFYFEITHICYYRTEVYDETLIENSLKIKTILAEKWKDNKKLQRFKSKFWLNLAPLISDLYKLFSTKFEFSAQTFHNEERFKIFLLSIFINDCYFSSIEDEELIHFERHWENIFSILANITSEESEKWWELAGYFYGQHSQIGNSYLQLDSIRLRNSFVEAKWLKHFSQYELEMHKLLYNKKKLELLITFKNQNNKLNYKQCSTKAKLELVNEEKELKKLKNNSLWAGTISSNLFSNNVENSDRILHEYRQEIDYLFRLAVKLLHPDRRKYIIKDIKLSKDQEKELDNLYNEIIKLRENNSLNPIDIITGDCLSLNKIKRIISHAKVILSKHGIRIPQIRFLILGDNFESQIDFLINEQTLLDIELAGLQAEIHVLYSDKEFYQKDSILHNRESIEKVNKKFEKIIKTYKNDISNLTDEMNDLFEDKKYA